MEDTDTTDVIDLAFELHYLLAAAEIHLEEIAKLIDEANDDRGPVDVHLSAITVKSIRNWIARKDAYRAARDRQLAEISERIDRHGAMLGLVGDASSGEGE